MTYIVERMEAVQYDGTNGDYICDTWIPRAIKTSDDGQTLVWETSEGPVSANLNDYVIRRGPNDFLGYSVSPTVYAASFHEIP